MPEVVALGGGVGTLHEITAALYYATSIPTLPVRLLGQRACGLARVLRADRWLVETPTRPLGFLRELPDGRAGAGPRALGDAPLAAAVAAAAYREEPYRLPDGRRLERYFDPYRLSAEPALLARTAAALAALLPPGTQALAGPALAAVPLVTALSLHTGLPACAPRASGMVPPALR
ncbi:hypothetical protein [Streptomyces qinglanensis]|uniref:hypothetical protein n=1 Tax=Streptomyces qinglanensis TaxID=943816 RepID=UPI003D71E85B